MPQRQTADHARITIKHFAGETERTSGTAMAELAGGAFPIAQRAAKASGAAFDWHCWFEAWRASRGIGEEPVPTHIQVEAADGFEAVIPWAQLTDAAVLYADESGEPLAADGPVRLFVPSGESACLSVKRVAAIRIERDPAGAAASYGFKRTFTPEEMRLRSKAGSREEAGQA